jgi:ferrous iron transport protein A
VADSLVLAHQVNDNYSQLQISIPFMSTTLAELSVGSRATVTGFLELNAHVQRIMALGLVVDTRVAVTRRAPTGDPIELDVLGDRLSIRNENAKQILVEAKS